MLGTGHFARASAVAEALTARGAAEVVLLTGEEGAAFVPAYFAPDTTVLPISGTERAPEAAMRALRERRWTPDVILLDHYGEVPQWETLCARDGVRLLVVDDLDAARTADVIARPHGGAGSQAGGIVLRGPAYLPLSRHVAAASGRAARERHDRPRLNVCFGGSDPTGETAKTLEALSAVRGLNVDVVLGPGLRGGETLAEAAGRLRHVTPHRAPTQERLAALMGNADLALGAGGVMLWERMCLGIPSLVICAAANQRPQIDAMAASGAIRFLGDHTGVTPDAIARAVTALAADADARAAMAETGRRMVDGRGAARIAAWLRALALGVRDVTPHDAMDLLAWRTDESNWRHNWNDAPVPQPDAHLAWLAGKLSDPACVFRIVTEGGGAGGCRAIRPGQWGHLGPTVDPSRSGAAWKTAGSAGLLRGRAGTARLASPGGPHRQPDTFRQRRVPALAPGRGLFRVTLGGAHGLA